MNIPKIDASRPIISVNSLPQELITEYRKNGFVHVPNVLGQGEIDIFRKEAERLFLEQKLVSWDDESGNVMDWVADVEVKSEIMRKLALHPGVTSIAEKLAGAGLRLLKSELLLKRETGSAATPMHIDDFAFPVDNAPDTLTIWVALVDVPVEKGCMTFIPGSHHYVEQALKKPKDDATPSQENEWDQMIDPLKWLPELKWYPRVTIPLRAGDCTIHHAKTLHMAGSNEVKSPRLSLTSVYTNINATYKANDYSYEEGNTYEEYQPAAFKGLKDGQHLPDNLFPKVGSRG